MDKKKKSRNLDNVSKSQGEERRKVPRISVTLEQFKMEPNKKIFSVCDLSENGMGLWLIDSEDKNLFSVGALINGHLNLRRQKYDLNARVRNISADRIGFEFEKPASQVVSAIKSYHDPAVLGAELKPISSDDLNVLWYHGPSGTDLLLKREADGDYSKFSLYVLGNFIQWERLYGLSTGRTHSSDAQSELQGILRLETLLLHADRSPDSDKLGIAKTVIMSSNLPEELKSWCLRRLATGS